MAEAERVVESAKPKKADKGGKKPHKNKPTSKKFSHYDGNKRKSKFCPRCGPGIFLAAHKDRLSCGKCKYTEFVTK